MNAVERATRAAAAFASLRAAESADSTFAALRATPRLVEGDAAGAEASDRETEVAVLLDEHGAERPWWWCKTHMRAEQTADDATCSWNGPYDTEVEAEAAP